MASPAASRGCEAAGEVENLNDEVMTLECGFVVWRGVVAVCDGMQGEGAAHHGRLAWTLGCVSL